MGKQNVQAEEVNTVALATEFFPFATTISGGVALKIATCFHLRSFQIKGLESCHFANMNKEMKI